MAAVTSNSQPLPLAPEVHVHATNELLAICEPNLRGLCPAGSSCGLHHLPIPYLWQVYLDGKGWVNLPENINSKIEANYADPQLCSCVIQVPLTYNDGTSHQVEFLVQFEMMIGKFAHVAGKTGIQDTAEVRRLSTPSYGDVIISDQKGVERFINQAESPGYYTQWRWYYEDKGQIMCFEVDGLSPMQSVIEAKYLSGQEVFRFDVTTRVEPPTTFTCFLDFDKKTLSNFDLNHHCAIKRRPLFCPRNVQLPFPPYKPLPFLQKLPSNWMPVNISSRYELVPLNPDSVKYHMVSSEFVTSMITNRTIHDIFQLQNPYLWNKYTCRKELMEQVGRSANEVLLFHGTKETIVQAIATHNFDWRLHGKNGTNYGQGSYFALKASLSDKYTGAPSGPPPGKFRWMFLVRVLVGRYTRGHKDYQRPPPLDPGRPDSDLYDSCVDDMNHPTIYVIFENDQCYPEYLISYR